MTVEKLQIKVEVTMQFLGGDAVVKSSSPQSQIWDFRVCYIWILDIVYLYISVYVVHEINNLLGI